MQYLAVQDVHGTDLIEVRFTTPDPALSAFLAGAHVQAYLEENDLPHNPLYDLGYASIGCAPCTRMRFPGEHEREGRWADLAKWECGIHPREAAQQDTAIVLD